ncbi:MAG: hypothetical protein IJF69_03895 [Clostridia bacterium]|nr:hypothetical protein [Clostridia bacterium]
MEINWITDVIVPLGSALIGGLLALLGVLITLCREKKELKKERIERAKPILINYSLAAVERSSFVPVFIFKSNEGENINILEGVFKNTDNGIAFIDYIKTETKTYMPVDSATVDKNMVFRVQLINITGESLKTFSIFCHDIYGTKYTYKARFKPNGSGANGIIIGEIERCE